MLYHCNANNRARYALGQGEMGRNTLVVFGINPSVASDQRTDPTWTRVQRMSQLKGFSGVLLLNIYPQRATFIRDLPPRRAYAPWHRENQQIIQNLFEEYSFEYIWCAWGNLIESRGYLPRCLEDIYQIICSTNVRWLRAGAFTKQGHPKHPLARGKQAFHYQEKLLPFCMESYLKNGCSQ